MKTINKNKNIIISFLLGVIITILIINYNNIVINIRYKNTIRDKYSLSKTIDKVYDSVVTIKTPNASGSGVIYKTDNKYAYILTNEHVVTNTKKVNIIFPNEKETDAEVLGKDEYLDVAVLRTSKKNTSVIATLGNSNKLKLGDTLLSIGTPVSLDFKGTVTHGIVSGLSRKVSATTSSGQDIYMRLIQTDTPINTGNSGGPLININGEVLGIVTLKITDNNVEEMSFAIPINDIKKYLNVLENSKKIDWPKLDIELKDTVEGLEVREANNIFKEGDIIEKVAGKKVDNIKDLNYELSKYKVGNTVEVTYKSNDKEKTTKVKLK